VVVEIKIDYSCCNSCKKCVAKCTFGVLEWFEEKPIVTNPNNCSGCLECRSSCQFDAIQIKEK